MLVALVACKSQQQATTVYSGHPLPEPVVAEPEPPAPPPMEDAAFQRQRVLANMLYDAKQAYDDNRLMQPAGRNAYELYLQVLQLDADNRVAREGLEDIALRYIAMADAAIAQSSFENADNYLARAARVSPNRAELATSRARLAEAKKRQADVHILNLAALTAKNQVILKELGEIARQLQKSGATFVIRARNDDEGRWIYKVMREAVGGYRLRGNIDISPTPSVLVTQAPTGGKAPVKTAVKQ